MTTLVRPSSQLEIAFAICHGDGHQWRHHDGVVGAPDYRPPFGMLNSVGKLSTCVSCGTERVRWYTRSGEAMNRYHHAEGYLHKRETPDDLAPTRQEWRQTIAVRLFAEQEQLLSRLGEPTDEPTPKPKRTRKAAAS